MKHKKKFVFSNIEFLIFSLLQCEKMFSHVRANNGPLREPHRDPNLGLHALRPIAILVCNRRLSDYLPRFQYPGWNRQQIVVQTDLRKS